MSRRKQARPSRHLECDEDGNNGIPASGGGGRVSKKKDDTTGKCEEEQSRWKSAKGNHKKQQHSHGVEGDSAPSRRHRHHQQHHPLSSPNDDDEMDDGTPGGHAETIPQSNCLTDEEDDEMHTEDANNNESKARDVSVERDLESKELQKESLATALHSLIGGNFPWPAGLVGPNVTLEAIQNTKVAMAQYAANALNDRCNKKKNGSSGDGGNGEGSFQELAALQSTLFTLQQQQLLQLQLLQHLQQQLVSKSSQNSIQQDDSSPPNSPSPVPSTSTTPQPREVNSNGGNNVISNNSSNNSSSCGSNGKVNNGIPHISSKHTAKPNTASSNNNHNNNNSNSNPTSVGNNSNNNNNSSATTNGTEGLNPHFASLLNCANQDPNQPLSPGLPSGTASTCILSPNGDHNIIREPNTLEVLQKRTQEVLDSASQGLLASSLVDDPNYRKKGSGMEKGREPFFKHRCRYCGKVFSSDSALQIHIRSHTGERPFKCNVCGSRFTTKGNLKVHFQRHTARFPHVRMNPHPVPEHLDHLHPPMRGNSSGHSTPNHSPTASNPFRTPPPPQAAFHPFNPLFHFGAAAAAAAAAAAQQQQQPMKLVPVAVPVLKETISSSGPEDLTKPKGNNSSSNNNNNSDTASIGGSSDDLRMTSNTTATTAEIKEEVKEEAIDEDDDMMMDDDNNSNMQDGKDDDIDSKKSNNSVDFRDDEERKKETDDCSMDSMTHENDRTDCSSMMEESSQDQPENLSSKSLPLMYPLPLMQVRPGRPSSSSTLTFARISPAPQFPGGNPMPKGAVVTTNPQGIPVDIDPAKDPAIYTNLLPRPGSNDNAWESLIEVTKTSETAKLQQLVDNIDHKVTDPNQCIICQRVLSCKSALQMHYRTHTGERPFKCKICGRTFTTKGNLKTHMGVHRAKPPLRALLQCPVCHKRFTNSLVLQQHIRLHTGEPTDLTPEQIRAAEVKDFAFLPGNHFPPFPPHGSPPLFLNHAALMKQHGALSHIMPPMHSPPEDSSPQSRSPSLNPYSNNSSGSGDEAGTPNSQILKVGDTPTNKHDLSSNFPSSLAALENQVKTVTTMAGSNHNGVKTKFCKASPNDSNSPPESDSPENESNNQDNNSLNNSSPTPTSQQQQQQQNQQQNQQQPFITSTIIPHNNLQFLKVNYVFVK